MGQAEQEKQNRTTRTKDSQGRITNAGSPGQDYQDRTARTGQKTKTAKAEQPGQDVQKRTAIKLHQTARKGWPR
jgi:hypothetical protein